MTVLFPIISYRTRRVLPSRSPCKPEIIWLNRIVAPRMEGMALQKPLKGLESPLPDPLLSDGFFCVFRTGGTKPARGRLQRRNPPLIGPYQDYGDTGHHFLLNPL